MNRTPFLSILALLAAGSALFALSVDSSQLLLTAFCFPFAQIGAGLRWLSLSGAAGNAVAWVLYVALGLLPLLTWLGLRRMGKVEPPDLLLMLLTPVLLVVLYNMVNPFGSMLSGSAPMLDIYKAQFGAVVYVILVGWLVLRILHRFTHADQAGLYQWLSRFVMLSAALFVVSAFGGCFGELVGTIRDVRAGNTDGGSLTLTYLLSGLRCLVDAVPLLMDTAAALLALDLLDAMAADSHSQAAAAEHLAGWCRMTLIVTTVVSIAFHVLQMLVMDNLRNVSASVVLPVSSITFLLICMAAARIVAENKALRDENDLYI